MHKVTQHIIHAPMKITLGIVQIMQSLEAGYVDVIHKQMVTGIEMFVPETKCQ